MTAQARIEDLVRRYKLEVLADIEDGIVPPDVATIEELHDYVDANTYAGLCDENADIGTENLIKIQEEVHRWLASRDQGER